MHPSLNRRAAFAMLLGLAFFSRFSWAQTLTVGAYGELLGPFPLAGVETVLEDSGATVDGSATSAAFAWSNAPCAGAVKIKFFRPVMVDGIRVRFDFITQRGPFDVPAPSGDGIYRVSLDPPVILLAGDVIALTNVTACGGPIYAVPQGHPFPLPGPAVPPAIIANGDVVSSIPSGPSAVAGIDVTATGPSATIPLLSGRFQASLEAIDPRNLQVAEGYPTLLSDGSGYFSLPDFTADRRIPEVTLKMVDATSIGGSFWFFHASLTDVQYTITVRDRVTGAVKTFMNTSASPGQLCGGVDTTAFPGP